MRASTFTLITLLTIAAAAPVAAQQLLRYRWTDPKTGQTVIKNYPPANLNVREVERGPDGLVTLEVIPFDRSPPPKGAVEVVPTPPSEESLRNRTLVAPSKRHEVSIGMTEDEVLEAWGRPKHINQTETKSGITEQWVYDPFPNGPTDYIYFDNGRVRSIQKSR